MSWLQRFTALRVTVASMAAAMLVLAAAATTPVRAADILTACSGDIAEYCSAVEPGNGRIAACLYAHEEVITDGCYVATADVGDFLDSMFAGLRVVLEACGADIAKLCSEVPAGEGRIFSCLADQKSDLSASCAPTVGQFTALWPADTPAE